MNRFHSRTKRAREGFTLVEMLVVITIIGILAGLAIPAVFTAIGTAKSGKMRLEVGALEDAVNQYQQKYGDYPPDFSSWTVVERHYRKIFPRIAPGELDRLRVLTDVDLTNDTTPTFPPSGGWKAHDPTVLDRGEVLAWTLGGYSSNPLLPFTGPGGPLALVSSTASGVILQINIDRDNKLYDFDPAGLDYSQIDASAVLSLTNRYKSSDNDLFLSYAAHGDGVPFVYFDSRTYALFDATLADFNGYGSADFGVVRPYYSDKAIANTTGADYASLAAALGGWQFLKPDSFQIIAPGIDGNFGKTATTTASAPLYYQYPTGKGIAPSTTVDTPGELILSDASKYQEPTSSYDGSDHFQQDNVANFSKAKLVDDIEG